MAAADWKGVAGLLGLAMRAGQGISGEGACVTAIRSGKAVIAMIDAKASQNAKKRFADACSYHGVPMYELGEDLIGNAVGKPGRMALVLSPGGLADKLRLEIERAKAEFI